MQHAERVSAKMGKFRPSLTLLLKDLVGRRREQGLPVYDFGLGETKGELAGYIREAGERAYREGKTMYGDPAGLAELRQAVLEWLGITNQYDVGNVVITNGAKQSLFNTFLAVCNPADCVLFDAAPWVSYQPLAVTAYATPIMVLPAAGAINYLKVGPDDLLRNLKMRPHAKLFLLNNPVNPTGQVYSAAEVEDLLSICVEHRVYFVLDRLYWRLIYDGNGYPEPRLDEATLDWVIQVDGMSKNFRRTGGIRIGWSVAPTDVSTAMANMQSHYTSGPAIPTQLSALAAITRAYDPELRSDLERKRDSIEREARAMSRVDVWHTHGAFYSFWDVRKMFGMRTPNGSELIDSDDVAAYLVEEAGVVTASGCGFMQDGYLRVSFAVPEEEIKQGIKAAAEAISRLQPYPSG
jgi:aspartate aminotransferase